MISILIGFHALERTPLSLAWRLGVADPAHRPGGTEPWGRGLALALGLGYLYSNLEHEGR